MEVEEYLIDGEEIKDSINTTETGEIDETEWDWYVTSERVIKHGEGRYLGKEEFHDLSLNKITGLSFEADRQNWLLGLGGLFILVGLIIPALPGEIASSLGPIEVLNELGEVLTVGGMVVGVTLVIVWYFSTQPYLHIRGGDSSERMTMEVSGSLSSTSSDEVRSFINTLRKEMGKRPRK
jgi:hypothetical protein